MKMLYNNLNGKKSTVVKHADEKISCVKAHCSKTTFILNSHSILYLQNAMRMCSTDVNDSTILFCLPGFIIENKPLVEAVSA